MPDSCEKLFAQIGACGDCRTWDERRASGALCPETAAVTKGENLFPRIDMEKALAELEACGGRGQQGRPARRGGGAPADGEGGLRHLLQVRLPGREGQGLRGREEERQAAEVHPGRRHRHGPRRSSPASATWYEPEELVGKTLVAIVNLPPRKMMGLESQRHADLRRPHGAR